MAALPAVPKVVRTSLQFTQNINTRIFIHWYFQYSGAMSVSDLGTVTTTLVNAFKTNILNLLSGSLSITGAVATDLTSVSSPQIVQSASGAGGVLTTANPSGAAMVVEQKIARRFRGGHARLYLPGTSNSQNTDAQRWTPAAVTAMNTGFDNFVAAAVLAPPAAVGTLTQVTVSYFLGFVNKTFPSGRIRPVSVPRGAPLIDPITAHITNPRVASQRRRNQQSL
jgi:hypothetical protein